MLTVMLSSRKRDIRVKLTFDPLVENEFECVCACVCVREIERESGGCKRLRARLWVWGCVCVCVSEWDREIGWVCARYQESPYIEKEEWWQKRLSMRVFCDVERYWERVREIEREREDEKERERKSERERCRRRKRDKIWVCLSKRIESKEASCSIYCIVLLISMFFWCAAFLCYIIPFRD